MLGLPIALGLSFFYAPIAAGWAANPGVYIFFLFCTCLFFLISVVFKNTQNSVINITKIDFCVLIFASYCFLRQVFLGTTAIQNDLLLTYYVMLHLYFSFRIALNKNFDFSISVIVHCIVISSVLQIGICATQAFKYDILAHPMSLTGSFANANTLAAYLSACLPFLYYSIILTRKFDKKRRVLLRALYIICVVFTLVIIYFTKSRGALIAVLFSPILLAFPKIKRLWKTTPVNRKYIILAGLVGCIFYLCYLIFLKKDSALGRILIWKITGNMFLEYESQIILPSLLSAGAFN